MSRNWLSDLNIKEYWLRISLPVISYSSNKIILNDIGILKFISEFKLLHSMISEVIL